MLLIIGPGNGLGLDQYQALHLGFPKNVRKKPSMPTEIFLPLNNFDDNKWLNLHIDQLLTL